MVAQLLYEIPIGTFSDDNQVNSYVFNMPEKGPLYDLTVLKVTHLIYMSKGELMIVTEKVVKAFRNLPNWVKNEMEHTATVGFIYSGDELLGWSWSPSLKSSSYNRYLLKTKEEIIPSEPNFYIEFMRNLMFTVSEDVTMISRGEQGAMEFGISLVDKDGDKEEILAQGSDRLETLLNLLKSVAEFYYVNKCPSLNDVYSTDAYHIMSISGIDSKKPDVDVFENEDGEYCIDIKDYFSTIDFLNRYSRFMKEEDGDLEQCLDRDGEWYHGSVNMMEGLARIYSNYGVKPNPNTNITLGTSTSNFIYNGQVSSGYLSPSTTMTSVSKTVTPGQFLTTGVNSQTTVTTGISNQSIQVSAADDIFINTSSNSQNISKHAYLAASKNLGKIKYKS